MSAWYTARLVDVDAGGLELAGGKGANLGELLRAGFAVPDGFVISTRLYRDVLRATGIATNGDDGDGSGVSTGDPARLRAEIEAMTIPGEFAAQICAAYAELGEGAVAVRSSATAEDLPGAAFAGQQETFLNVVNAQALLQAVRNCWASLWSERAVAYRNRLRCDSDPEIAVVVQRMVPAELAGVMFTANPVTGVRDEVVIDASPGLGEAVVSGLVTAEHVVVDRRGRIVERRPGRQEVIIRGQASGGVARQESSEADGDELPAEAVVELAAVGVRIAEHFGRPQDIEWAYAEDTMWIVQTRPLTALPPAPVGANRLQREAGAVCAELVPTRPYPLDLTAWTIPGWFAILARMVADVPAILIDVEAMLPETDGVVTQLLPPKPRPTWRTLTTPLRVRRKLHRYDPARWTCDPRFAAYEHRLEELRGQDPTAMTWPELMAVPGQVIDLLNQFVDIRIDYLPGVAVSIARLRILLTIAGASRDYWPLLAGEPTQTRAANDALHAIAAQIRRRPDWQDAFTTLGEDDLATAVWHDEAYAPLQVALRGWLHAYGHRETTSAALISAPTWEDDPQLLLGALRGLVTGPQDAASAPAEQADVERQVLARLRVRWTRTGAAIARAAAAARAGMAFREDSHFHALRVRPVLIRAVREAADRLTRAEILTEPRDIFHLRLAELRGLSDPCTVGPAERARWQHLVRGRILRRAEFGEAPLISPATLYPGVQRPNPDALVAGTPGGGGRATGPVRVIREPGEFGRLRRGDVLVCPYTNPAWTPLFQRAAAVVADSGSFGSHAAIVAREYGIPAVMGTGNGTQVLTEGLSVVVDGDRGDVVAAEDDQHRG